MPPELSSLICAINDNRTLVLCQDFDAMSWLRIWLLMVLKH